MRGRILCLFAVIGRGSCDLPKRRISPRLATNKGFVLAYSVVLMALIMVLLTVMLSFINNQITITKDAIDELDVRIQMQEFAERYVAGVLTYENGQWSDTVAEGYALSVTEDGVFVVKYLNEATLRVQKDHENRIIRWTFD